MRLQDISIPDSAFATDLLAPETAPAGPTAPEPVTVWLMDEPQCAAYDDFLQRHRDAGLYHTLAWRDALAAQNTGEPFYLAAMRGDRVVGALPLVERRDMWGRRRLVSLPATPVAGVIADDEQTETALLNRAMTLAQSREVSSLLLRQFTPRAAAGRGNAVRDWIRVPVKQFAPYACSYPMDVLTYKPTPFTPDVLDLLRDGRPYAASTTSDNLLTALADANALTECSIAYRDDGRSVGALVWKHHHRHIHILAYGASRSDTMTCRALIKSVLAPARLCEAEWIDLPMPRRFDAWFDGLAKLPGVDVAVEERIALRQRNTPSLC